MKNHTLALSLLIGAALTVSAMAAPADTKAAKKTTATAEMAVEAKVESTGNETDANTSKMTPFVISETQTISRARVNSNMGQQPMTTEIKAPQEAVQNTELQTTEMVSEDAALEAPEDLIEMSEENEL